MITHFGKTTMGKDTWDVGTYFQHSTELSGNGYHRVSIVRQDV